MATLSSSSTDTEVRAAYDDNGGYVEDASPTKAAIFITACRLLIRREADASSGGGTSVSLRTAKYRDEIAEAQQYINAKAVSGTGRGPRVVGVGLRG